MPAIHTLLSIEAEVCSDRLKDHKGKCTLVETTLRGFRSANVGTLVPERWGALDNSVAHATIFYFQGPGLNLAISRPYHTTPNGVILARPFHDFHLDGC